MATGTFAYNAQRTKTLKERIKTQRKIVSHSNLTRAMLLVQERLPLKHIFPYAHVGLVWFARYCGKMYSRHLFSYGGLMHRSVRISLTALLCAMRLSTTLGRTIFQSHEMLAFCLSVCQSFCLLVCLIPKSCTTCIIRFSQHWFQTLLEIKSQQPDVYSFISINKPFPIKLVNKIQRYPTFKKSYNTTLPCKHDS